MFPPDPETIVVETPDAPTVEVTVQTPAPAEPTPAQEEQTAIADALNAAAAEDHVPPPVEPGEDTPEPAVTVEVETTVTETPEPTEDEKLAQQDTEDAKALGFKNQKATTEFKSMRSELRELRPLRDQLKELEAPAQHWGELNQYFQEKAITPKQFGDAMLITAAFNSDSLDAKRAARDELQRNLVVLNEQLGEEGAGYDPLQQHADLARRVEDGDLSRTDALELARARHTQTHTQQLTQRQQQEAQQAQQYTQVRDQSIQALNVMGAEFQAVDPLYQAKVAAIQGGLREVFKDLPPRLWPEKFKAAYLAVQLPEGSAPRPPPLRNQPLRPTGASNGMAVGITTEADAFQAALRKAAEMDGVVYKG